MMSKKAILKQSKTFYLFAKPSFIEGMARVLDLGGNLQIYNESPLPIQSDSEAILRDWQMVGEDIKNSINVYEREQSANI